MTFSKYLCIEASLSPPSDYIRAGTIHMSPMSPWLRPWDGPPKLATSTQPNMKELKNTGWPQK